MNNPSNRKPPKLKASAYPVVEAGGMVWTYLGPHDKKPPFTHYKYMDLPENHCAVYRVDTNANWVQTLEGGLDSSHVGILHTNGARPSWSGNAETKVGEFEDTEPVLEIEDTEFGYHYAAFRRNGEGQLENVRIVPFIMPSGRIIPGGALQGRNNATLLLEIPIDDEHTATYSVRYSSEPITRESRLVEMGFDDPEFYCERTQKFLFTRNDFHRQRRDLMDHNWSGFRGIATEDLAVSTSMGPIQDRTKEHLIASDLAVARFRRRVLDSVERMERGEDPVGTNVDVSLISSIDAPVPKSGHWRALIPTHRVEEAA